MIYGQLHKKYNFHNASVLANFQYWPKKPVKRRHEGYLELLPSPIFPEGAYITWGIGHLVELKEPKEYDPKWAKWSLVSLPILPERYEFQVAKGKSKQFAVVKKLIKGTDTVINACDVDISL